MMIASTVVGGGIAMTAMAKAILAIYGVASDINDFINKHIDTMKTSDNPTIARSGRILEGAKFGFGIGYIVPVAIIAVGQLLLGNELSALSTAASAAALSNPIAMTCAAIGAIYYGWNALSEREQNDILERLQAGLEVGIELIKSIVGFVIAKTKELLSAENIRELKQFVSDAAATFGKTLADVTGAIKDHVAGAVVTVKRTTAEAGQVVVDAVGNIKRTTVVAGESVVNTLRKIPPKR